jgi:fatty-acyl-CoA synthase
VALRAHLEQRLARYKIPRYVQMCDDLPRNATGKVLRSVLREQASRDHPSPG